MGVFDEKPRETIWVVSNRRWSPTQSFEEFIGDLLEMGEDGDDGLVDLWVPETKTKDPPPPDDDPPPPPPTEPDPEPKTPEDQCLSIRDSIDSFQETIETYESYRGFGMSIEQRIELERKIDEVERLKREAEETLRRLKAEGKCGEDSDEKPDDKSGGGPSKPD